MRKLYEIFKVSKVQKRIVFEETIRGNTVSLFLSIPKVKILSVRSLSWRMRPSKILLPIKVSGWLSMSGLKASETD